MSSNLPTLLRRGFVVPPEGSTKRQVEEIKNIRSIDYIIHKISSKIPESMDNYVIKYGVKSPGDRIIILKAKTGSGKSTVLPVALFDAFFNRTGKNVSITQPRIITAIDIAESLPVFNPQLKLGRNLGYRTQKFKLLPTEKGILFFTVGILVQELLLLRAEKFMQKYQFIMIDEVHERSMDVDLCLFLIKKFLKENYKNPSCPLIILTSATFDEKLFIDYFEVPKENYIEVIGSTFPIEMNFPEYSISDYVTYASIKAQKLHLDNLEDLKDDNPYRDIIIFVKDSGTGRTIYDNLQIFNSEILTKSQQIIDEYLTKIDNDLENLLKTPEPRNIQGGSPNRNHILPILLDTTIFSNAGPDYQNLFSDLSIINAPIFKDYTNNKDPEYYVKPSRRIIVITNVAETGITIPTLKYCIDTGFVLISEFYPEYNCKSLMSSNITHMSAMQRRGRVGRKSKGYFYPCYTEETFNALPTEQPPTIIVEDMTDILLNILIKEKNVEFLQEFSVSKIKNNRDINSTVFQTHKNVSSNWYTIKNELSINITALDLIEPPSIQSLKYAYEKLHILGFMDINCDITTTGFYANQFQFITLEMRKVIMSGYYYGANILDLVTIIAFVYTMKRKVFDIGPKKFNLENFMGVNNKIFDFYKILISDDFITCVFVWNIYQDFIKTELKSGCVSMDKIREWCENVGIKFAGLMAVTKMRDDIIANMIDIGLNPYYNDLSLSGYNLNTILTNSLPEGLAEIKKLKSCIYEGFKCNILKHEKASTYISLFKNIPIKVKSLVMKELNEEAQQKYPKYIVCDAYMLTQKFGKEQYEFKADGFCSALDNFVEIDEKFFLW